ncbi:MAG TPA: thioredoxin family protein [Thermoanaerobaculia bacterium]|nr:thioredoxin family protein [Thermoanaerobaculia bacterium]
MTHTRALRRACRPPFAALLLLLAFAAAGPAGAQGVPSDSVLRDFHRIGDYVLEVDGKDVPAAEIYQTERVPAFLIITSALPSPVMLTPRTSAVETVQLMKVAKQKDGTVDLLADAILAPQGQFTVVADGVSFAVDGHRAALKAKPPLLGLKRSADLKAYSPSYAEGERAYRPDVQALAALRKSPTPATVRVFFGSWCPHCKKFVPNILRVEDELKGSKIRFEYFGLPQEGLVNDPEAKKFKINGVPTGIVFINGKEAGRLVGNAWNAPEASLKTILRPAGGATSKGR